VVYAGTPAYDSVVLFNPAATLSAIIGLTLAFLFIGTFFFTRSEQKK
jgi:ABC-2 type transport system permease protein